VLDSRKEGKEVYFWLNKDFLRETLVSVLDYLEQNA